MSGPPSSKERELRLARRQQRKSHAAARRKGKRKLRSLRTAKRYREHRELDYTRSSEFEQGDESA